MNDSCIYSADDEDYGTGYLCSFRSTLSSPTTKKTCESLQSIPSRKLFPYLFHLCFLSKFFAIRMNNHNHQRSFPNFCCLVPLKNCGSSLLKICRTINTSIHYFHDEILNSSNITVGFHDECIQGRRVYWWTASDQYY